MQKNKQKEENKARKLDKQKSAPSSGAQNEEFQVIGQENSEPLYQFIRQKVLLDMDATNIKLLSNMQQQIELLRENVAQ